MRWADPLALWGLLGIGLLSLALIWGGLRQRQARLRLASQSLLPALLVELSSRKRRWRQVLLILAALGFLVASLRPQWGARTELAHHRGLDVVFALDVSRSMLAQDVAPDRLRRAKLEISALTDRLNGNRMALVAFAGSAFVQCPLTTDSSAVKMFLDALSPDVVPQGGTALARALTVSARLFSTSQEKSGDDDRRATQVLILITDGEDHEGQVKGAAERLAELGVQVFVVGIGSKQGEPIPDLNEQGQLVGYVKDAQGKTVLTRLDVDGLSAVAKATHGQLYVGPRVDQSLLQVASAIDKLAKAEFAQRLVVQYSERYQWPLALALLSLALALLVPERRRQRRPKDGVASQGAQT